MESNIRSLGLLLTLIVTLYALYKGRDAVLTVIIFIAPLSYFAQSVGFVLTPAKLMGIIFAGFLFFNSQFLNMFNNTYLRGFILYYGYCIVLTLVMTSFWPEYRVTRQGFLYSNTMRGFVQIIQIIIGFAIVIMLMQSLNNVRRLFSAQVKMLYSMTAISAYGIYVWFAQSTGLPFNPISRQGGRGQTLNYVITSVVNGKDVVRAYSLTGEPKALSVNAGLGIIIASLTSATRVVPYFGNVAKFMFLGLLFVALYMTLSTAGYLILPLIFAGAGGFLLISRQITVSVVLRFALFGIMGFMVLAVFKQGFLTSFWGMLDNRVGSRITNDGFFTYAEKGVVELWKDRPYFIFTGVGLGGSSFFVRIYNVLQYAGFTAAPRGIIGFIADRGIFGLILFGIAVARSMRTIILATIMSKNHNWVFAGILAICGANIVMLFTYTQWYLEWTFVGVLCATATLAERELANIRTGNERSSVTPNPNIPVTG